MIKVLQAEIEKIRKLNLEFSQRIQAQKRANTLDELENHQSESNGRKDESREESKNLIYVWVNSEIWIPHREKTWKRRQARSAQEDSKVWHGVDQEENYLYNREPENKLHHTIDSNTETLIRKWTINILLFEYNSR